MEGGTLNLEIYPFFVYLFVVVVVLVRVWDIRTFAPSGRQLKIFRGNRHGFEKVSVVAALLSRRSFLLVCAGVFPSMK